MSEEAEVVVAEPGGWLAEQQRAACTGATPLTTFQGLICDEIVLPNKAADAADPTQLIRSAEMYAEALQNIAYLIPGEFAPEVLWSFYASDYITQAKAGGHTQYYAMRGADPIAVRAASSALKSMLAAPHLEIFNLMVRLKRNAPREARRIAAQAGYNNLTVAFRDLDRRLIDLEQKEPLAPRHKAWLKSFRKLKVVPEAELGQHMQGVISSNPLFEQRRAEAERVRAEQQKSDPAFKAVRALCEMAGLKFKAMSKGAFGPMRRVWTEGPDRNAFGFLVDTDKGQRAALFYVEGSLFKRRLAVLIEAGQVLPVGSLTLDQPDYAAIVPGA